MRSARWPRSSIVNVPVRVSTSTWRLLDGLIFQSNGNLTAGALGIPLERYGNQFSLAAPVNVYACSDGRIYGGVLLDSHWRSLCALLGREDLASLRNAERIERRDEVDALMAAWCSRHPADEVVDKLAAVGVTATRVNTYAEAARHPQVAARDMLQTTRLSDGSDVPLTGPAAKFSRTPTAIREAGADLGPGQRANLRRARSGRRRSRAPARGRRDLSGARAPLHHEMYEVRVVFRRFVAEGDGAAAVAAPARPCAPWRGVRR